MTAAPIARVWTAVLLVAGTALAGCGTTGQSLPPSARPMYANWPELLQEFRFRWAAEPGIDLLTGPAVPLRAYLESHRIGDMTGDAEDAYPGFARAVPHPGKPRDDYRSDLPRELWGIQPASSPFGLGAGFPPNTRFHGNEYFYVLELSPVGDGYRAYVCDGQYDIFHKDGNAHAFEPVYTPSESTPDQDWNAIDVWRVEFTDHPTPPVLDAPAAATGPQRGPNPAPLGDAFGRWQITGANSIGSWGPRGSGTYDGWEQRKQLCIDRMPHDAAQRQAIYASKPNTPPVPEPAAPGWPDNVA